MSTEREAMTLEQIRAEIAAIEYECHKSALTLGQEGLRGMCIEAQKRLHKLLPAINAHLAREKAEPVLLTLDCGFQIPIRFDGEKGTFVESAPPELHLGSPKPTAPAEADERLRAFAKDIMRAWPEGGIDGGELQEAALRHGLLEPATPTQEERDEWGLVEGDSWYRKTALLTHNYNSVSK